MDVVRGAENWSGPLRFSGSLECWLKTPARSTDVLHLLSIFFKEVF